MQPIDQINKTIENTSEKQNDLWIYQLPEELRGVIPENIWTTLSLDQKKQVLRDYGLYDKYVKDSSGEEIIQGNTQEVQEVDNNYENSNTPNVIDANNIEQGSNSVISEELERIKENEEKFAQDELSQAEQKRIDEETAKSANTGGGNSSVKVFGYTIPLPIINNAKQVSVNGNVKDGSTWAAVIVKKLFAIFD